MNSSNSADINDKEDINILNLKGEDLYRKEEYREAVEYYDKVLEIQPDNVNALHNRGITLCQLGLTDKAIKECFDKILQIDPTNTNALNCKGYALCLSKKYREAIEFYDKVLAIDCTNIYTLYNKFLALFKLQEYDEAITYCDKVFSLEPDFCYALGDTMNSIPSLEKKYHKVIACYDTSEAMECFVVDYFDRALSVDPNNIKALNCKGYALCLGGQFKEAIECYDKALTIDPDNIEALFNKGVSLIEQPSHEDFQDWKKYYPANLKEAIKCFDKILQMNPDNSIVLENRENAIRALK